MQTIKTTKFIVSLNLASCGISNEGFGIIFDTMAENESIVYLNLQTIEGANRNRLSKKGVHKLKNMLTSNQFLDILVLSSTSLGDLGMQ
jgi:hypothetical protein